MADMVRENEQRIATYTEQLKEKDDRIKELEQELRSLKNSSEASSANHEAAAKVDRNDLAEIHRRYAAVLSTLNAKKCSLNNAYRLAGTARSAIRDFIGIAELKIVNEVTYQSTLERLGDPKLPVKGIEQECRRQLGGLLPLVKRLRTAKKLLPLALDHAFYSEQTAPLGATKFLLLEVSVLEQQTNGSFRSHQVSITRGLCFRTTNKRLF